MSDFTTYVVPDARISHIKDNLPFAVISGAGQNTFQSFPANSTSTTSIVFNVQVPSMSTVIDREILVQTTINFQISCTNVPTGSLALDYAQTDCLQAFPFNSLISTLSATINNATVSLNEQDILAQLMKMNNDQLLSRYNSMTPVYPDSFYLYYENSVNTNCNVMAGLDDAFLNQNILPRGCYPIQFGTIVHNITAGGTDTSLTSTNVLDTWVIPITVTVTEPLFLSPFANSENDKAGFLGINNMVLNFNIDNSCRRLWSSSTGYITNIQLTSFTNSKILMNFLSLQSEQYGKISARNILPYLDMPRFLWQVGTLQPLPAGQLITPTTQGTRVSFNNIQLNQIPDLMIICCRKTMATQNWNDSSHFFSINNISINFNNQSGILSSANSTQLYLLSQKNGSSQTYTEWNGQAFASDSASGRGEYAATMGSLLILNPSVDFGLQSFYSASSGGQYNFQMDMNVTNQSSDALQAEICVVCVNSGMFITENGTSTTQTGILTKEAVLDAKSRPVTVDTNMYHRMVGGALHRLRQLPQLYNKSAGAMCAGDENVPMEDGSAMAAGGSMHHKKVHRFLKR